MIKFLSLAALATTVCLALQVAASVLAARYFARISRRPEPRGSIILQFSVLMLTLLFGNFIQVAFWAVIYRVLGAFEDFETALYFSGVTFTTLGYGDVLLTGHVRLVAPLQAANGLMMFAITTALFITAFQHAVSKWAEVHGKRA